MMKRQDDTKKKLDYLYDLQQKQTDKYKKNGFEPDDDFKKMFNDFLDTNGRIPDEDYRDCLLYVNYMINLSLTDKGFELDKITNYKPYFRDVYKDFEAYEEEILREKYDDKCCI